MLQCCSTLCAFAKTHRLTALTVFTRFVYVTYAAIAMSGYGNLEGLLGKLEVCPQSGGHKCASLSPVVNACLMSNIISIIVVLSYTGLDTWLRFRARAGCCKAPIAFTTGLKAGLNFCLMVTLMQSSASFLAVGLLVQSYNSWGDETPANESTIMVCGGLSCLGAALAVIEVMVVFWVALRKDKDTSPLIDPLRTDQSGPYSNTYTGAHPYAPNP